jgi:hypothetical protein
MTGGCYTHQLPSMDDSSGLACKVVCLKLRVRALDFRHLSKILYALSRVRCQCGLLAKLQVAITTHAVSIRRRVDSDAAEETLDYSARNGTQVSKEMAIRGHP